MKPRFFPAPEDFRGWLDEHHENESELLVGFYKKTSGKPSIAWAEAVDEALCFGWIDGVRRALDADSYTIRFTPRKPSSTWSSVNVARVEELSRQGRMRPAGLRAFARRDERNTGIYSYERRAAAELPEEFERRFRADGRAWSFFESQPPWYRRTSVYWVVSAKREETRRRRLTTLIDDSRAEQRIGALARRPRAGAGR
jgi:uncharacterized protein YdeI (YjbR/CyaY-like superfamily)